MRHRLEAIETRERPLALARLPVAVMKPTSPSKINGLAIALRVKTILPGSNPDSTK